MTTNAINTISLVLTSQDRTDVLDRFILSLFKQEFDDSVELIFVNQGSYDPLKNLTLPIFIKYKMIAVGHLMPLSAARNIGLEHVTGNIVAFPDDDCWYESTLLKKIVEYFDVNPGIACVCTNVYDPDRHKSYGKRPIGVRQMVGYGTLFKLVSSAGIFCRAEALALVERRFDESLGAGTILGSGEEMELIARFLEFGMHVEYNGYIQVYHPFLDYIETDCLKYYRYGLGFGYLNGCLLRRGHFTIIAYLLKIVFLSFAGAILNMNSIIKRKLYMNRFCGIVKGTIGGIRGRISA